MIENDLLRFRYLCLVALDLFHHFEDLLFFIIGYHFQLFDLQLVALVLALELGDLDRRLLFLFQEFLVSFLKNMQFCGKFGIIFG